MPCVLADIHVLLRLPLVPSTPDFAAWEEWSRSGEEGFQKASRSGCVVFGESRGGYSVELRSPIGVGLVNVTWPGLRGWLLDAGGVESDHGRC